MNDQPDLVEEAISVLRQNDTGTYTVPAPHLYPHQWLWDSCFTAIGIRHYDIDRAKSEITSLLRGQWHNGMLPNMIFTEGSIRDANIWKSDLNPNAPDSVATSGITQPPMLAEAIVRIGEKLKKSERKSWYKSVYPALLAYHEWLYSERDPHGEGLTIQVHPWEVGLDNTPPWMTELHEHQLALWIRCVKTLRLGPLFNLFRNDTKRIPSSERIDIIDALGLFSTQRRLRRKNYVTEKVLRHSLFAIEDVTFNSIFVRANQHLKDIASTINQELPEHILPKIDKTEKALEGLWDEYSGQYYSRNFTTHSFLKQSTLGTFMPLYAGTLSADRAKHLVRLLENQHSFGTSYPVPSVPISSPLFDADGYWQGPTWINTNWLIIDGLRRNGFPEHAQALSESTIELVARSGFYEYFNALDGSPAGAADFSWTAALTIDLIKN